MDAFLEGVKQFLIELEASFQNMAASVGAYLANPINFSEFYTFAVRWIFPILAIVIFFRCIFPMLRDGGSNKIWGFLQIKNSYRIPIQHWENSIGRSKLSDIVINLPFVSRSHAVLSFGEGGWTVTDLGSKGGVQVNGESVDKSGSVEVGDTISLAGADFLFLPAEEGVDNIKRRSKWDWLSGIGKNFTSLNTFLLILVFQFLGGLQVYFCVEPETSKKILFAVPLYMLAESIYYFVLMKYSKKYTELELLIYFLCGLDLFVVAVAAPTHLYKQLVAIIMGMAVYFALQLIVRDLGRGRKLKYVLVACSILLILLNLTVGEARFGARNWINLGFITFQPMEFVKVAFCACRNCYA